MTSSGDATLIVAQFIDRRRNVTYTLSKLLGRYVLRVSDTLGQGATYLAPSEEVAARYYVGLYVGVKDSGRDVVVTVPLEGMEGHIAQQRSQSSNDSTQSAMVTRVTCPACGSHNVDIRPDAVELCLNCHRAEPMRIRNPHFGSPIFVPAQGKKPPFAPAVGWAETFTFTDDPRKFSDHEHVWNPFEGKLGKLNQGTGADGKRWMEAAYQCARCALRMDVALVEGGSQASVFPPDTFLHFCGKCSKIYRDGHPFSEFRWIGYPFCSATCMDAVRGMQDAKELRSLIPTLEMMVRNATDEGARTKARERLEVIATDESEPLASLARKALERLGIGHEHAA